MSGTSDGCAVRMMESADVGCVPSTATGSGFCEGAASPSWGLKPVEREEPAAAKAVAN